MDEDIWSQFDHTRTHTHTHTHTHTNCPLQPHNWSNYTHVSIYIQPFSAKAFALLTVLFPSKKEKLSWRDWAYAKTKLWEICYTWEMCQGYSVLGLKHPVNFTQSPQDENEAKIPAHGETSTSSSLLYWLLPTGYFNCSSLNTTSQNVLNLKFLLF